jgi:hypothetical protein
VLEQNKIKKVKKQKGKLDEKNNKKGKDVIETFWILN